MFIKASKFFLVGILVAVLHLSISYFMVHQGYSLLWANGCAFVIAFFVSYFLQSSFTFRHAYSFAKLGQFALVALVALLVSQAIAYASVLLSIPVELGVLLAGLAPAGISFFLNHAFVFKNQQGP